jgi:hypothetical protein
MLFMNTVQTEFFRKLFYGGHLKSMQPYLKEALPADQVVEFNVQKFREQVLQEINRMMQATGMEPLTKEATELFKIFLAKTILHPKTAIQNFQLEKPRNMTLENWRKYLKDLGFTVIENDPYVNDRTGTVTAYADRIESADGRPLGSKEYWQARKNAENSQFVYYMKNAE